MASSSTVGGDFGVVHVEAPYLIFVGDAKDELAAKTGYGIVDWHPERVLGQLRFAHAAADLGVTDLTIDEAAARGAKTLVIGCVNPGGTFPETWLDTMAEALAAGLDIASGLHTRLDSFDRLTGLAAEHGRRLIDVRVPPEGLPVGNGEPRSGKRLLTVGTDCSIGKKYAALALERELAGRGVDVTFRATGQTGILISGRGIAIDAVVSDFVAGAAEVLSPAAADDHWDVIEGQGSLLHPSFGGVSLGLLQGSQPDAFVVCHEPTRTTMRNVATPMPSVATIIDLTQQFGAATCPDIRCVGIAVNTAAIADGERDGLLADLAREFAVPAVDPIRDGVGAIVDVLLEQ